MPEPRLSGAPASALLIVDLQRDFCRGGALAVPAGDDVVPVINRLARAVAAAGWTVYASRDWHPPDARHFAGHGGLWPVHCVAHTDGARFHPDLQLPPETEIVTKGDRVDSDGYSAFEGHTAAGTALLDDVRRRGITRLVVVGLATDYCVRHSALDAAKAGFDVTLLEDAVRGVEVNAGDTAHAIAEMRRAGVHVTQTGPFLRAFEHT